MGPSTALTDPTAELVADASTVINLIASGYAPAIASALPNLIVVADVVPVELEAGEPMGYRHSEVLRTLIEVGLVHVVSLGEVGTSHFEGLVIGPTAETLDDGEAATIAYAAEHSDVIVLMDERKAMRICGERFPTLRLACSVDIFMHPNVEAALGSDSLQEAVYNALQEGRMRVLPHHLSYVVELIGPERASACRSLPKRIRASPKPP